MINGVSTREIAEKLKPAFNDKKLRLVLLFGSAASGRMRKGSDIDLAFLFDGPADILALTNEVIRLLHTDNIDVVDLNRANPLLKFSVAKNGTLIYEREHGLFNQFFSLAFRMYVDTKKLRDAQATAIRRFVQARAAT